MSEIVQNCLNLFKIVWNCLKLSKIVKKFWKLSKIVENWSKTSKIGHNCSKLSEFVQNCPKLFKIVRNCPKLFKIVQNCSTWFRLVNSCTYILFLIFRSGWPSRISSSQSNLPSLTSNQDANGTPQAGIRHKPRQVPLGANYYPPRPQRTSAGSRRSWSEQKSVKF